MDEAGRGGNGERVCVCVVGRRGDGPHMRIKKGPVRLTLEAIRGGGRRGGGHEHTQTIIHLFQTGPNNESVCAKTIQTHGLSGVIDDALILVHFKKY